MLSNCLKSQRSVCPFSILLVLVAIFGMAIELAGAKTIVFSGQWEGGSGRVAHIDGKLSRSTNWVRDQEFTVEVSSNSYRIRLNHKAFRPDFYDIWSDGLDVFMWNWPLPHYESYQRWDRSQPLAETNAWGWVTPGPVLRKINALQVLWISLCTPFTGGLEFTDERIFEFAGLESTEYTMDELQWVIGRQGISAVPAQVAIYAPGTGYDRQSSAEYHFNVVYMPEGYLRALFRVDDWIEVGAKTIPKRFMLNFYQPRMDAESPTDRDDVALDRAFHFEIEQWEEQDREIEAPAPALAKTQTQVRDDRFSEPQHYSLSEKDAWMLRSSPQFAVLTAELARQADERKSSRTVFVVALISMLLLPVAAGWGLRNIRSHNNNKKG